MLQREHSAILSTFIKLPFFIKTFVFSISKWLLKTGFTVTSTAKIHSSKSHPTDSLIRGLNLRPLIYKTSGLSIAPQQLHFLKLFFSKKIIEPVHEILVLITFSSKKGSGESAQVPIARAFSAHIHKFLKYSKHYLKRPLKNRQNKDLNDKW